MVHLLYRTTHLTYQVAIHTSCSSPDPQALKLFTAGNTVEDKIFT